MRHIAAFCCLTLFVASSAAAQEPGVVDIAQSFAKAVADDDFASMKSLVGKHRNVLRYVYLDLEAHYLSAVANNSEKDMTERGNVVMKLGQLSNLELKDGWYMDRWQWTRAKDAAFAAANVKIYAVYDRGDREFVKARAERTGDLWAKATKEFVELDQAASEAKDPVYSFFANWYLAECHLGQFNYFESVYCAKKAIDWAREAKLTAMADKEDLKGLMGKAARNATPEIDPAKVDVRLTLEEAKTKYYGPAVPKAPEGEKPTPGGEAKPAGGGEAKPTPPGKVDPKAAAKDVIPPKANDHGGKVDWIEIDKTKMSAIGDKGFLSPFPGTNNNPLRWLSVRVPPGGDSKIPGLPGDHKLINDKGKFLIDLDGGGKGEPEKMKLGAKPEAVKFPKRDLGDGLVGDVTLRLMEMPTSYKLMGFDSKENPTADGIVLLYTTGMSVSAKFEGYDVTIYDDNADGFFNSWGDDCLVVTKGAEKRVQPLSKYAYVGNLLYEVGVDASGKQLRFRPYEGPIGLVKLDYGTGPAPASLVIKGSGDHSSTAFNLVEARDKWMWIPAGEYQFAHGYFAFGPEGDKRETIQISTGRSRIIPVKPDVQNVIKMGGAETGFQYVWKAARNGDVVTLKGQDLKVYGAGGELYEWFMPGILRPHVRARLGAKGPPFFDKQMTRIDEGVLRLDGGLRWHPKDLEIKVPGKGDLFLQLEEDYPKLGKIKSEFVQVN
jgi:hypothetical protein